MDAYQELEIYSKIKKKILALTNHAWNRKIDWTDVDNWLGNFEASEDIDSCEKIQMLHILSQFMYFGDKEIKELLQCMYRDKFKYTIVSKIRKANRNTLNRSLINSLFNIELSKSRFLGVGNPSESGTHLLYYFRQENNLKKDLFINKDEIFETEHGIREERDGETIIRQELTLNNKDVKNYIFIDDMCGSGNQACDYLNKTVNDIKTLNPNALTFYYVLFANRTGLEKIRNNTNFDYVDCIFELDETFKCFSDNSRHYKSILKPIDKTIAKEICYKYGQDLLPKHPLGYSDNQLLIGFNHNTPDNTLPIIWYDKTGAEWQPIFKRYNKNYGWGS